MDKKLSKGDIAFMFPGVGSQYFKMGEELYKNFSIVRDTFQEASEAIKVDLTKICFEENDGKLNLLEYSKPALVCLSVAIYRVYMQTIGKIPKYCMGYSLGEYSALCCAGILKLEDALQIVRERAMIVNQVSSKSIGTMAWVINTQRDIVEEFCSELLSGGDEIYISSYDSKMKLSVSGTMEGIRKFAEKVEDVGGLVFPIKMSGPFHSPLMTEAARELKALLQNYEFHEPKYGVISNRNASLYNSCKNDIIENLTMQLCEPVLWDQMLHFAIEDGVETAIELGPKTVLKYLIESSTDRIQAISIEKPEDINSLLSIVS